MLVTSLSPMAALLTAFAMSKYRWATIINAEQATKP
jgi:hypothetical protein